MSTGSPCKCAYNMTKKIIFSRQARLTIQIHIHIQIMRYDKNNFYVCLIPSVGYCVGFLSVGNIVGGRTGEYFPLLALLAYAASL